MPAKRLSMRKIKEILRLKWVKGLSNRQIARTCGIARPTVAEYLRRATEAGLSWPLPAGLDESALEQQLFPPPPKLPAADRGVPNWSVVHRELRSKKGVTVFLLWQEYREAHPEGYQYSLILRALPRLARQAGCGHAPGPPGRGVAVRRLCRPERVCRGHLHPGVAGLDRLAPALL